MKMNIFLIAIAIPGLFACKSPEERKAAALENLSIREEACATSPMSGECSSLSMWTFVHKLAPKQGRDENGNPVGGFSELMKKVEETERTKSGDGNWFVIWDGNAKVYKAVSVSYIRELEMNFRREALASGYSWTAYYTDDQGNKTEVDQSMTEYNYAANIAKEFQDSEDTDVSNWEVVSYDPNSGIFTGTSTGYKYEDENETRDVSLMVAEKEALEKFERAANLSSYFQMNVQTSLALVTLAEFSQASMGKSSGATLADQQAFSSALSSIAGVSAADVMKAAVSERAKDEMVEKIAKKIGTSAANLENRILPELFGVSL